jgi:hypothetical protein
MKDCKDCIHEDYCYPGIYASFVAAAVTCDRFKDKSRFVELPCQVGDTYYTVERFCTEGGQHDERVPIFSLSTCEWCSEECDKEFRPMEWEFHSIVDILQRQSAFGKYYFLTYDEAKQEADKRNGM